MAHPGAASGAISEDDLRDFVHRIAEATNTAWWRMDAWKDDRHATCHATRATANRSAATAVLALECELCAADELLQE
jgi:hypothetical protein